MPHSSTRDKKVLINWKNPHRNSALAQVHFHHNHNPVYHRIQTSHYFRVFLETEIRIKSFFFFLPSFLFPADLSAFVECFIDHGQVTFMYFCITEAYIRQAYHVSESVSRKKNSVLCSCVSLPPSLVYAFSKCMFCTFKYSSISFQ